MKITRSSDKLALKALKTNDNEIVGSDSSRTNKKIVNSSQNNKSRNLIYVLNIRVTEKLIFLILDAKQTFNYLKQMFIKVLIF